jgi:hypothetical protein
VIAPRQHGNRRYVGWQPWDLAFPLPCRRPYGGRNDWYLSPLGAIEAVVPDQIRQGQFWNSEEKFSLTVENINGKPIQSFSVESEHFLSHQSLHRPFEEHLWTWDQPVAPGQEQMLERKLYPLAMAQSLPAGSFFLTRLHLPTAASGNQSSAANASTSSGATNSIPTRKSYPLCKGR